MKMWTLKDYLNPKKLLDTLRYLCKGKTEPIKALYQQFNKETNDGKDMSEISTLLDEAILSIIDTKEENDMHAFLTGKQVSFLSGKINGLDDFELICFLVIKKQE